MLEPFEDVVIDETAQAAIAGLWPLEIGKEISFRKNFRPTDGKAKARIRVKSTKSVTIAGVTRRIYVVTGETGSIKCSDNQSSSDGWDREFSEVWWYDPQLAAVVHYELNWSDSDYGDSFEYDLVTARFPEATMRAKASSAPKPRAASSAPENLAIDRIAPPQMVAVPQAPGRPVRMPDLFGGIHFGNYYALVIGNNKYKGLRDLKTAVPDARAVGRLLKKSYAFNVELLINATRNGIIGALARMRAKLGADDSLLIYYAGHGVLDDITEQGYWLPVDAEKENPANWVSTYDITTMLRAMRAKHVMVVADSCYSGTLVRAAPANLKTFRERRTWIKRMVRRRARTALVSGGLEPVLDSGGGGHSVFAKAFLNALRENDGVMEGEALFDAIKRPVALESDQTPEYSDIRKAGHEGGEFLFVRRRR